MGENRLSASASQAVEAGAKMDRVDTVDTMDRVEVVRARDARSGRSLSGGCRRFLSWRGGLVRRVGEQGKK
jgi:hypothetical protein